VASPARRVANANAKGIAVDDLRVASADKLVSELLCEDPDLRDIIEEFVDGLSDRIVHLKLAFDELDWSQLRTLAHRLKGAGGSYGYPQISQLAARMEQNFKTHRADDFDTQIHQLERLASAAHAGLQDG
jgi:HPt (histidine-containing phosphotransfer) domain-containing protein